MTAHNPVSSTYQGISVKYNINHKIKLIDLCNPLNWGKKKHYQSVGKNVRSAIR
jgi:hypothetical protein